MVVIMIIGKLNLILCTSSYNSNDYLLAAYLIKKSNQIESIKMVDILKDTKVSKSTLLRFLKKLGYKNYTDVQYLITKEKKHQEIFKERIIEKNLRDKLAKKQRLIVIGDSYSVSSLIVYKQKFYEIGIDLDIQLSLKSYGQMVVEKKFTGSDLIIVVSLYKCDLDLMAEFFSGYLELKHFIKEQKIDHLYVGKIATGNRNLDECYRIDDNINFSEAIYQLCSLFEKIYNFYAL